MAIGVHHQEIAVRLLGPEQHMVSDQTVGCRCASFDDHASTSRNDGASLPAWLLHAEDEFLRRIGRNLDGHAMWQADFLDRHRKGLPSTCGQQHAFLMTHDTSLMVATAERTRNLR